MAGYSFYDIVGSGNNRTCFLAGYNAYLCAWASAQNIAALRLYISIAGFLAQYQTIDYASLLLISYLISIFNTPDALFDIRSYPPGLYSNCLGKGLEGADNSNQTCFKKCSYTSYHLARCTTQPYSWRFGNHGDCIQHSGNG